MTGPDRRGRERVGRQGSDTGGGELGEPGGEGVGRAGAEADAGADAEGLTHVGPDGRPRMVDVSSKDVTARVAVAEGRLVMRAETLQHILSGRTPKGGPIQVAEIAGVMAGKRAADLIPLCHQLPGASVEVRIEPDASLPGVVARAEARISGRTGVEMEALTAVAVALLTVYDMVKAVDRGMRIEGVRLLSKEGGRSGRWSAGE